MTDEDKLSEYWYEWRLEERIKMKKRFAAQREFDFYFEEEKKPVLCPDCWGAEDVSG